MAVEFSSNEYQFSHGKQPRGYGYWGFFFDDEQDVEKCMFHPGKFAEAKQRAMAYAITKGHTKVRVAP
jgi:hypothetical protein